MSRHPSRSHPDDRVLAEVAAGDRSESDAHPDAHLASCARCMQRVDELRQLIVVLGEASRLPTPPPWFRTRALAAIRRRRERGSVWAGFMHCLHDSILAPALSPVRGPAAPGRQLLLQGPGLELDLRLLPPAEETPGRLTGQVLLSSPERSDSPDDLAVEITDERGTSAAVRPDRFGIFSIAGDFQAPLIVTIRSRDWTEEAFVPEASL